MKHKEGNNAEELQEELLEPSECTLAEDSAPLSSEQPSEQTPLPISHPQPQNETAGAYRDSEWPVSRVYTYDELLHLYDENPLLNFNGMVKACDEIFGKRKSISKEQYQRLTKDAYKIDMEKYARKHNFTDGVLLAEIFSQVSAGLKQGTTHNRNSMIIIGCGQGRLAEVYIALAQKTGIETIILNDLIEDHIEATRAKIASIYKHPSGEEADGVKIIYKPGDILTVDLPDNSVDAAYMWWYVGAEFCDPGSDEAMLANRMATYERIHRLLIPGGAWIDDMPDPNKEPGLYNLAAFKTAHILKQRNILPGTAGNLLLTNWSFEQEEGFPYQLRWAPLDGADNKLKNKAGFRYVSSEPSSIPLDSDHSSAEVVVSTLRSIDSLEKAMDALQKQVAGTVVLPKRSDRLQRRRIIKWFKAV